MLKELISARAFRNICELFAGKERDENGSFELDHYEYNVVYKENVYKLNAKDRQLIYDLFKVRVR